MFKCYADTAIIQIMTDDDINATTHNIEFGLSTEEFSKWKEDESYKNIINNVIVSYDKDVKVEMISDTIAWNIANLTKPVEWEIPQQAIPSNAKVKSVLWIKCFKSYVMAYMRLKWRSAYVRIFNTEKFKCLRTNESSGVLFNFKQICDMVKKVKNDDVRFYFVFVVCCFADSLNFNCRVCYFFVKLQAWQFKFSELQHEYITLADQFMDEHKINYRDQTARKDGCIHKLARYSGTIIRRQICPKVSLRRKKAEVDEDGNKIRRRNVYDKFDPKCNINDVGGSDVDGTCNDGNVITPESTKVSQFVSSNDSVTVFKDKIKEYALKWKADGNGNYVYIDDIDDVSNLSTYLSSYIILINCLCSFFSLLNLLIAIKL